MLLTDRRRGFGMRDDDSEGGALQGSLFAPESLAPPSRHARPPGPTPDPFAPPPPDAPGVPDVPSEDGLEVSSGLVPTGDDVVAAPAGPIAPDDIDAGELAPPPAAPSPGDVASRRPAAPLSGPTLDDVISRVWEGMRAEVPAPCPVCRTEVEPSMGGRCGSCGSAID
jgi:hypothetical protein